MQSGIERSRLRFTIVELDLRSHLRSTLHAPPAARKSIVTRKIRQTSTREIDSPAFDLRISSRMQAADVNLIRVTFPINSGSRPCHHQRALVLRKIHHPRYADTRNVIIREASVRRRGSREGEAAGRTSRLSIARSRSHPSRPRASAFPSLPPFPPSVSVSLPRSSSLFEPGLFRFQTVFAETSYR